MKKLYSLFFLCIFFKANAQQIISIQVVPATPTTTDTIRILINCQYPNTSCDGVANFSQVGNNIYGNSFHCMGLIATICTDMDTIKLNPQPAGNYILYYSLDAGYGLPTCTPGFVPYDYDTAYFTVSPATGIAETENNFVSVYPNPAHELVNVTVEEKAEVIIINSIGQKVGEVNLDAGENKIDVANLPEGIYFFIISQNFSVEKIVILKN